VVQRPFEFNAFEFAVVSGLRARQLALGCTPRVGAGEKITVIAQLEVAAGLVARDTSGDRVPPALALAPLTATVTTILPATEDE
jgi:DNA-directed RNA polymerase subunit K/omega